MSAGVAKYWDRRELASSMKVKLSTDYGGQQPLFSRTFYTAIWHMREWQGTTHFFMETEQKFDAKGILSGAMRCPCGADTTFEAAPMAHVLHTNGVGGMR